MAETGMDRWEREQANRQARSGRHGAAGIAALPAEALDKFPA
jgi:hypothetical protein